MTSGGGRTPPDGGPRPRLDSLIDEYEASRAAGGPPAIAQRFASTAGGADEVRQPTAADIPALGAAPPERIGPYRLVEKLGEGGMGAVWKAVHTRLDKTVALKLLPHRLLANPDAVARFEREMRAAGKVCHPNVVQAFDAGEAAGVFYLAMEFIDGVDLSRLVAARGPLDVADACRVAEQAALGLAAAHTHRLVHRDVKPQNLLLARNGTVKLLDLGLARLVEEASAEASRAGLTAADQVMGTADYMAPEQWEDARAAGEAADLYSLGCTLFFLLTGRPPFGTERHPSIARKMQAHLLEPVPSLKAARPDVPPELEALCDRLMAKRPAARPASAAEVAAALAWFHGADTARVGSATTPVPPATGSAWTPTLLEPTGETARRSADVAAPRRRSRRIWMMAAAVAAAAGAASVACCGGGFMLAVRTSTQDAQLSIEDNPVLLAHLGEIREMSAKDPMNAFGSIWRFDVVGTKGQGELVATLVQEGVGPSRVVAARLTMSTGESFDLFERSKDGETAAPSP